MKNNTVSNDERNVVRKMSEGFELFYWQRTRPKTFHLSRMKPNQFGIEDSTVKKSLIERITERGLISEDKISAGRVFYVLTEKGRELCR